MNELHWILLKNTPIFQQLQLEEELLRARTENYCIVNLGSPKAIIMGISGDPTTHLNIPLIKKDHIPVYQRFSGGGTVIVDENTLFVTFVLSHKTVDIPPYPEPILRWSASLYQDAWKIPNFLLQENDYIIETRKCGGNAQYITKDRWVHHTSFLWDYSPHNMDYLLLPPKQPKYRQNRPHDTFLCRMKDHTKLSLEDLANALHQTLEKHFILKSEHPDLGRPHRKSTRLIPI